MVGLAAQIALDGAAFAFDKLYTYAVPPEMHKSLKTGCRVTVPFGGGNTKTWTLEITITKVSHNAEEVDVTTYLNLDGKTMMLVTVKGTPENGSAFTYDGNTMYKVEGYGTDWYAWLVILEKDQTLTKEDAAAKVAVSAADNVVTIANGYDVNMTGVVDINDAQLVYDIYNGTYGDFGKVSMEKFLRADVNASKNVDSADAVAIVSQFK